MDTSTALPVSGSPVATPRARLSSSVLSRDGSAPATQPPLLRTIEPAATALTLFCLPASTADVPALSRTQPPQLQTDATSAGVANGVDSELAAANEGAGAFASLGEVGGKLARASLSGLASGTVAAVVRGGRISMGADCHRRVWQCAGSVDRRKQLGREFQQYGVRSHIRGRHGRAPGSLSASGRAACGRGWRCGHGMDGQWRLRLCHDGCRRQQAV